MWVHLTKPGYNAVMHAVQFDEALTQAFTAETIVSSKGIVEVNAPYVAWLRVYRIFYARVFGPRGGRKANVPDRMFTAMRRIVRELNYVDRHPAMKGIGVMGWSRDILPAWELDGTFTPYPRPNAKFVMLTPRWREDEGMPRTTTWDALSGPEIAAEEKIHLALWGDAVAQ